jgi:hypothetical protein
MHRSITWLTPLFFFFSFTFSYAQFDKQTLLQVNPSDAGDAAQYSLVTTLDADQDNDVDIVGELPPETAISPIYVNFNNLLEDNAQGWTNLQQEPEANTSVSLIDALGKDTGAKLTLKTKWDGTGQNGFADERQGFYPKAVTRSYYFTRGTEQVEITGLDSDQTYRFSFYGSSFFDEDRTTLYRIGAREVELNASFNTTSIVTIENVIPNSNGGVTIEIAKKPEATIGFLGALVIEPNRRVPSKYVLLSNSGSTPFAVGQTIDEAANWAFALPIDVNQDSYPDLLVYDTEDRALLWYENQSGGSFKKNTIASNLSTSVAANDITVLDLNQDGKLDILVAEDEQLFWYEQSSSNTFSDRTLWAEGGARPPSDVSSFLQADIDGDKLSDIIWQGSRKIYVLNSSTAYAMTDSISVEGVSSPIALAATDMNGDNQTDLLITEGYNWTGTYRIGYLSNNSGSLSATPSFLTVTGFEALNQRPQRLLIDDVDQDGDLDFFVSVVSEACSSVEPPQIGWIENQESWQSAQYHSLTNEAVVQWADMDQDGDQDLITDRPNEPGIYWEENASGRWDSIDYRAIDQLTIDKIKNVIIQPSSSSLSDLIIQSTAHISELSIQQGNILPPKIQKKVNSPNATLATGDLDNDGIQELLVMDVNAAGLAVVRWRSSQTGITQELIIYRGNLSNLPIFLSAGGLLFAPVNEAGSRYGWWKLESGSFTRSGTIEGAITQIVDLNTDGFEDVVTKDGWYQNSNDTQFQAAATAKGEWVVDLDGDSDPDILDQSANGQLIWYKNNGNGDFSDTNLNITAEGAISFADLDADGDADIILSTTSGVVWQENTNGEGIFGSATVIDELSAQGFRTVDADDDGDIDIITYNSQQITLFKNTYQRQVNREPVVQARIEDQIAKVDTSYRFEIPTNAFLDNDAGDVLTYSVSKKDSEDLPQWLKFNQTTRILSGVPVESDTGLIILEVKATDSQGASASQNFNLTVQKNQNSSNPGGDGGGEPGDGGGEPSEPIITAVGDEPAIEELVLYPNPVRRGDPVFIKNLAQLTTVELRLYSSEGKMIEITVTQQDVGIDSSPLVPGIYLLELRTAQQVYRKRMIIW